MLAFAEEAVKQVFANMEMCSHSQWELLKKCWRACKSFGIPKRSCEKNVGKPRKV